MISAGELNGEGIALYLPTIDSYFEPIKNEILSAMDSQMGTLRSERTEQLGAVERDLETFEGTLRELYSAQRKYEMEAQRIGIPNYEDNIHKVSYEGLRQRFDKIREEL